MMRRYLYILFTCALSVQVVVAQYHKSTDGQVNHYLTFSVAGGETNMFTSLTEDAPAIKDMPGADALFQLSYELRKRSFFVGLGIQADYDFTWQRVDTFSNLFERTDREYDPITYAYRYSDYRDRQHTLQLSVPLYVGANVGRYFYVLAGAKVSLAFVAEHKTTTLLSTDGTYHRFIHTIVDVPSYGYYYEDLYASVGAWEAPFLKVSPMAEFGFRIPVKSKSGRVGMRAGFYAEYGIPLDWSNMLPMIDYRHVDDSPFTQSQDNLRENIVFNSVLNSSFQKKAFNQLTVGLRWTLLINVTPPDHVCMCDGGL